MYATPIGVDVLSIENHTTRLYEGVNETSRLAIAVVKIDEAIAPIKAAPRQNTTDLCKLTAKITNPTNTTCCIIEPTARIELRS